MVMSPSGNIYAAATAKTKKKREDFPRLKTPRARKNDTPVKTKSKTIKLAGNKGKQKAEAKNKARARSARVGPIFVAITGDEGWKDLRKSIEQKIPNPRVRTVKSKNGGIILFPEDAETAAALRRTSNLIERAPRKPRVIIKFVDRLLEREVIPWALSQNKDLGIGEFELPHIKPLFMLGPREGHVVQWVVEVAPETLTKIKGKLAFLGMIKCRMKFYDCVTQCYNCQGFGHTAAKCNTTQPICKHCSEKHDSRTCKSLAKKCLNCRSNMHNASHRVLYRVHSHWRKSYAGRSGGPRNTAQKVRKNHWKKHWWSPVLSTLRRNLVRKRREGLRVSNRREYNRLRNEFLTQIRVHKLAAWKCFAGELNANPWCKAFRWAKGSHSIPKMPSTMSRPDGSLTSDCRDTAELLLNTFVPADPDQQYPEFYGPIPIKAPPSPDESKAAIW